MNKVKVSISIVLTLCMVAISLIFSFADENGYEFKNEAYKLNKMGLYKGTSTVGSFEPNLASSVDVETGILMLIRIFGMEQEANELTDDDVAQILANFDDANMLHSWAVKSIAFALRESIFIPNSKTMLEISVPLTDKMYSTMIINKLGYEITDDVMKDPAKMIEMAKSINLKPEDAVRFYKGEPINIDKLVGMTFKALYLKTKDGSSLLENLLSKGIVEVKNIPTEESATEVKNEDSEVNGDNKVDADNTVTKDSKNLLEAAVFEYENEANKLHSLGLYKGMNAETFVPNLSGLVNRETGVVMLLRFSGFEKKASELSDDEVTSTLAKYEDAHLVSSWAKKSIAYAVKTGIIKGVSATKLDLASPLTGKMYCTMIINKLGYTITNEILSDPMKLLSLAETIGLEQIDALKFFTNTQMNRDSLVGISFKALTLTDKTGKTMIKDLVASGEVTQQKVYDNGLETKFE